MLEEWYRICNWPHGIEEVYSCLFAGIKEAKLRKDFKIPEDLSPTVIMGFGYSRRNLIGKKKNRLPNYTLLYNERYR
jgi:hypothetical protein